MHIQCIMSFWGDDQMHMVFALLTCMLSIRNLRPVRIERHLWNGVRRGQQPHVYQPKLIVYKGRVPQPHLWSNADDLRVLLHCTQVVYTRKLIFSADTDVYYIGMTQISHMLSSDIIVQLSKPSDKDSRFIQMNSLIQALENDPDLSYSFLPQYYHKSYSRLCT